MFIIYQQIHFIQNADPGYNKNNVLRLTAEGNLLTKQDVFIDELKKISGVNNASATYHRHGWIIIMQLMVYIGQVRIEDDDVYFEGFEAGYDFIETMGMQMKEGRSFSKDFGTDSASIILNETAIKAMHLKKPIGKTICVCKKNV